MDPVTRTPDDKALEADGATDEADRPIGRRVALGMLGLGGLGILWGAKVQNATERALRPITKNDPTGLTGLLPSAGNFRYYDVTNGTAPHLDAASYKLSVTGLVDTPLSLTLDDLTSKLPQTSLTKDFQCVTGWRVTNVPWVGVLLRDVLAKAGVQPAATHLRFTCSDGTYTESLTMAQATRGDVLVAHHMENHPVPYDHGGPVRLYVAPMYGYKSAKWLTGIELTAGLSDPGFWEQQGYDTDAWIGKSNGRNDQPVGQP
jgi:DMSO/TMAO reductase YedYZ molybdopterin-dependent catalytic subunit